MKPVKKQACFLRAARWLAPLAAVCVLSACESLTPAECATADWRQLGLQDGTKGSTDRAADYYDACTKAGFKVDVATYRAGRNAGLQGYCRADNAVSEGLAGRSYAGVCPPALDANFRTFHDIAYRQQDDRKTLARLQRDQDKMQAELRDAKTAEDRKETLRDQLSRMDRRLEEARDNVRTSDARLDRLRRDLNLRGPY
jgi:Protein of unknown function (DUF2799)